MAQIAIEENLAGGEVTSQGQDFVTVNGALVIVSGDPVASHGAGDHASASMSKEEYFFTINDIPVIIHGDSATCGHTITATGFVDVG